MSTYLLLIHKEVSEVDIWIFVEALISSFLEKNYNLMHFAQSINLELIVLWEYTGKKVYSLVSSAKI